MFLHDDVIDVENDEAPEFKKKNPLYLFCTSVRGNPVCAGTPFIRVVKDACS